MEQTRTSERNFSNKNSMQAFNINLQTNYIVIDKNTFSRESIASLIYEIDEYSMVYDSDSPEIQKHVISKSDNNYTLIFNGSVDSSNYLEVIELLNKHGSLSWKILLIVNDDEFNSQAFSNIDHLENHALVKINDNKNEMIRALKALKLNKNYFSSSLSKPIVSEPQENSKLNASNDKDQVQNKLTSRQLDVLKLIIKGYANKLIAYELGVSEGTVKLHVSSILKTLGVTNRTEAAIQASNDIAIRH